MQDNQIDIPKDNLLVEGSNLDQTQEISSSSETDNENNSSSALDLLEKCEDCRGSRKICTAHEEYKKELILSLTSCFKTFNKDQMIKELDRAFQIDNTIHLEISADIRSLSRKYELPSFLLQPILRNLKDQNISVNIRKNLAQAVKYGFQHNLDIRFEDLIQALEGNCAEIKSEMIFALAAKLTSSEMELSSELITLIKEEMNEDIDPKAKSFLKSLIDKVNYEINGQVWQENPKNTKKKKILNQKSKRRAKMMVAKNLQASRIHQKNTESQESQFEMTSITSAVKNQQRKKNSNDRVEKLPEELKESQGSNVSWLKGTYANAKNLFNLAKSGETITDADKDKYLTNKFFNGSKYLTPGFLGHFVTDRIIAATFQIISEKQSLADNIIKKLMLCLKDSKSVCENYYQNQDMDAFLKNLLSIKIEETSSEIRKKIFEEIQEITSSNITDREKMDKAEKLFFKEVDCIRRDAISAFHACTLRDPSLLKNRKYVNQLHCCLEDQDKVIRGYAVKILGTLKDNQQINYAKVFKTCLSQLENNEELEHSMNYIDQQSKDPRRCQELFTEEAILRLSKLLRRTVYGDQLKIDCNEIIQNYLEHEKTKSLELEPLEDICWILQDSRGNNELQEKALISVLLAAEKEKKLPNSIIAFLVENMKNLNASAANFIIIILGTICDQENTKIPSIEKISSKLLDDQVIIGKGSTITFESPSSENSIYIAVSVITGTIILSILKKKERASSEVLNHLTQALKSEHKQTRILAARAIFLTSENNQMDFSLSTLAKLEDFITDEIPDVAIYITSAFTKIYSIMPQENLLICSSHMDIIAEIFTNQELRLNNEDFSDEIKKNILTILANQARKQEFSDSIFCIFDQILISDDPYKKEALDILRIYTRKQNIIPESTVLAIESVLHLSEFSIQVLHVLEKVVKNEQILSDKILDILANNVYSNDVKEEVKSRSFKVLKIAERNQDLSDKIFQMIEVARASFYVESNAANFEGALEFLERQTNDGRHLPLSVFKTLNQQIENPQTLSILINVSTNKQKLPEFMIPEMVRIFNSGKNQEELLKIFFSLIKNHENIETNFFDQLENGLHQKAHADEILLIFAHLAQKGKNLSENLIKRLSEEFFNTENSSMKHECLLAFCSIIKTQKDFSKELSEQILIKGLNDDNEHIARTSLDGFKSICSECHLSQESIETLVQKIKLQVCPHDLKHRIAALLDAQPLNSRQSVQLKLATLNPDKGFDALLLLLDISDEGEDFLEQNFQQINQIMNENPKRQKAAIKILTLCPNKKKIPEDLIETIAALMLSTSVKALRDECLSLIGDIAKSGGIISSKALSLVFALQGSNQVLDFIGKNQKIPEGAMLLLQIDSIPDSVEKWELNILLKHIIQLDHEFKMTEAVFEKLLSFAKCSEPREDDLNLQEFALIFSRALLQDSQYLEKVRIVEIIEWAIQLNKIDSTVIQAYGKLIRSGKCKKITESLESLIKFLPNQKDKGKNCLICLETLSCLANAANLGIFCQKGIELMEENITSQDVKISGKCFQGLRARKSMGFSSEIFEAYCEDLKVQTGIQVDLELDLLETLTSLKYWDLSKLKPIHDQAHWIRELLLSDLLARLKVNEFDKLLFYKEWLATENYLRSQGLDSNKFLKALAYSQILTLDKLCEILKFLPNLDLNEANFILLESLHPFGELKRRWLISLLIKCLDNKEVSKDYADLFASDIGSKLPTSLISKLFSAISKIENLTDFDLLKNFVLENKVKISDISLKDASIPTLKRSIELKLLSKRIQSSTDRDEFITLWGRLRDKGWSFEQLMEMLKKVESNPDSATKTKEENLLQVLASLVCSKIPADTNEKILEILGCKAGEWIKKVNEVAIQINFQANPQVKNHVDLVEELKNDNANNLSLQDFIQNNQNLSELVDHIQRTELTTQLAIAPPVIGSAISNLTKDQITAWAKEVKLNPQYWSRSDFLRKALSVINRANALHTGFLLTNSQILSCIVILNANPTEGRLLQVATGEGKSTIVSVIAIIHALRGKKVDIITSSPVLAERDAREKTGLYKMFDLTCMDNTDKSQYSRGPKNCYKQAIVYGEIAQFQFDTLRDEYSMLGTLAERKCEVAIIDEVDSMLIDDSSNIARLSSTIAGMDLFQAFTHLLWCRLDLLQKRLIMVNGKTYLLSDEAATNIQDLKGSIKNLEDLNKVTFEIEEDIETFLKKELEKYVRKEKDKIEFSQNFEKFVDTQISKWIENTIRAFVNQEDQQYVIHDGLIKPVAYDSTGVVQSSTSWGDGLHQSIQRKHGVKMTSETFTTNFLSNIGYIKRFGSNLFGLTGTLGSEKAKQVLSEVYNVDLVLIPSLYKKRYLQLSATICKNQGEWLKEICESALREANKERGVLIICQTIEDCKLIGRGLVKRYRSGAIKLYTMNNMNQEREIDKIYPGEIIVATNLAGRGTDIKTDDIEKDGGLHVIVTFLPQNQRVEDQAFGRTSRQGKLGTGHMILDRTMLLEYDDVSSQEIKNARDHIESRMFDEFLEKELEMVNTKDQLFTKFCDLKKDICQQIKDRASLGEKRSYIGSSVYDACMLSALEERWALFLHQVDSAKNENGKPRLDTINEGYSDFETEIRDDYKQSKLIGNPYYHITIANDFLAYEFFHKFKSCFTSLLQDNNSQADHHLNKAIGLDPKQRDAAPAAALVGKAWLAIKDQKKEKKDNKDPKGKAEFIQELNNSLKILHDEMALLNTLQSFVLQEHLKLECDLSKQMTQKATILGSYISSIQNAATVIKRSQRLIDVTGFKSCQKDLASKIMSEFTLKREDEKTDVLKATSNFYGLERIKETKKIESKTLEKLDGYQKFTVVFNDLTMYSDSGKKDQAVETISGVFESQKSTSETKLGNVIQLAKLAKDTFKKSTVLDPEKYKDLVLTLKELNIEQVKTLFDTNIEMRDVSKELALCELEKKYKSCTVNLERVVDGKKQESKENLKAKEALKILESSKNEQERFNILVKDANEIAKSLKKENLKDSILILEYSNLDSQIAGKTLEKIRPHSLHLSISGQKSEILKALKNLTRETVKTVQLASENDGTQTFYIEKARERIESMVKEELRIKIEELRPETAKQIISLCSSAIFEITFNGKDLSFISGDSEGESINLSFTQLKPAFAKKLISILRTANLKFTLAFNNLNLKELKGVIKKASLDQEEIHISKVTKLSDQFLGREKPHLELAEFAARGIEYLFEVNEKGFIPWRSITILMSIAALQIIVGTILLPTVFGWALITESVTEFMMIYKTISHRHFSWSEYLKHKAISLTVSAMTLGFNKLSDVYKAGSTAATRGVQNEIIEQAATEAIKNSQSIGGTLVQVGNELKKIGVQRLMPNLTIELSKRIVQMTDCLFHFSFESFRPQIFSFVQGKIKEIFYVESFKKILHKVHALEKIRKSRSLPCQMSKTIHDIVNPEKNRSRELWDSIGMRLCKAVLWKTAILKLHFAMGLKITEALGGLKDIISLIEGIQGRFAKKLSEIDKETFLIHQLLEQYCNLSLEEAMEISKILKTEGVVLNNLDCEYINPELFEIQADQEQALELKGEKLGRKYSQTNRKDVKDIDFGHHEKHKDTVLKFCEDLNKYSSTMNFNDLNEIIRPISEIITEQTIRVAESHMISPESGFHIRNPLNNPSDSMQLSWSQEQSKNHKDFGIDCFQELEEHCANIHLGNPNPAQQDQNSKPNANPSLDQKMKDYIEQLQNSKPANLADMLTLASQYGINLRIVENADYIHTEEEKEQDVQIVFYIPGKKSSDKFEADHYRLLSSKKAAVEAQSSENDCGFAVISAIFKETGADVSVSELRSELIKTIERDPLGYIKLTELQDWVKSCDPQEIRKYKIDDAQIFNSNIESPSQNENSGPVVVSEIPRDNEIDISVNGRQLGEKIKQEPLEETKLIEAQAETKSCGSEEIQNTLIEKNENKVPEKAKQLALEEKTATLEDVTGEATLEELRWGGYAGGTGWRGHAEGSMSEVD